jgi:hypothetical protein
MPSQSQAVRRLRRFKPGHLVTDQDLNLFVEAIKDLDRRLAALQAARRRRGLSVPAGGSPVQVPVTARAARGRR